MKIAFIGQKGLPAKSGGVERHVEDLATRLAKQGHEVFAYSRPNYSDPNIKFYKNVRLISLPSINSKNFDAISHTIISTFHALFQKYDIIHYQGVGPSTLAFIARLFTKSKIISTFHCQDQYHQKWGFVARKYLKFGEWAICKFAHQTIVVSKILRQIAKERYNTKTVYIPNGINFLDLKNQESDVLEKLNLEQNKYILTVGRLVKHKGIHYLIDAFNKIKTDKKLVIVGDSACTDDYVKFIKEKARSNPNIILTGAVFGKDLHMLYKKAYLYVQPSEAEGLPTTVLEAMSHGRCVLVSNIPENIEAFAGLGYLFMNKNISDLASKLEILNKRTDLIIEKGEKAKAYALENYNWDILSLETEIIYEKTLQNREELSFNLRKIEI